MQPTWNELTRSYSVWDEKQIKGFFGEYRWLSNFHECDVYFEGIRYPSSEHAFMAAKTLDPIERCAVLCAKTPAEAKKIGRTVTLRPDWETVKTDYMLIAVLSKFWSNPDLRMKLLATGDKYLEETCHWHDNCWGSCVCDVCETKVKNNYLGKILMRVRDSLRPIK